jgi:PEP-CTERM motif
MATKKSAWLLAATTLLILNPLHGASITENGTDQPVQQLFVFPPGTAAFPISFRSDVSPDNEGSDLADILTATFPGEAQRSVTGSIPDAGTTFLYQMGFKTGGKIDQITVDDPGLFGGASDFVALYFDTVNGKFALGFTSCSVCSIPPQQATIPEPTTYVLFGAGVIGLFAYGYLKKVICV